MRQSFSKSQHLCLRRDIDHLFAPGNPSMVAFPLRLILSQPTHPQTGSPVKVLLSVSKRKLRHAVDRNRAKRQLREAYRHHQTLLTPTHLPPSGLHLAFLWIADTPQDSQLVSKRMHSLLRKVAVQLPSLFASSSGASANP